MWRIWKGKRKQIIWPSGAGIQTPDFPKVRGMRSNLGKEVEISRLYLLTRYHLRTFSKTFCLFITAGVRPFRIGVRFDQNEAQSSTGTTDTTQEHGVSAVPNGIIGFSLNYVQQKC